MTQEELKNLIEKDKQVTKQTEEHEACYNTADTILAVFIWVTIIGGLIASMVYFFTGAIAAGIWLIAGTIVGVLVLVLIEMIWKSIYLVLVEIKNKLK